MIESRISGNEKAPWLRCRGCKKSYWAENWHCKYCHENFTAQPIWHRKNDLCVPASRMGWELIDDVWQEK